MEICDLFLDQLDLDDRAFDLGFGRRYEDLRRSVAAVGVLQPLLVRERVLGERVQSPGAGVQVVCGFGRACVASELGRGRLPARVLEPGTTGADCLRLALFDNLAHRRFNPIERAIILTKLEPHIGRERLIEDYLPLLGLQPSAALFERTVALDRLVWALKVAVAEGRVEENVAARLAALPPPDQEAVARLLDHCRPSVSILRELAETLLDLSRRDARRVSDLLAEPGVASILDSGERSAGQKTAALRRYLHGLRYPTYSNHQDRFAAARAALRLPPSMRLEAAPRFESEEMRLEIRFRDEEELRRSAAVIACWFDDPSLLGRLWPDRSGAQ